MYNPACPSAFCLQALLVVVVLYFARFDASFLSLRAKQVGAFGWCVCVCVYLSHPHVHGSLCQGLLRPVCTWQ